MDEIMQSIIGEVEEILESSGIHPYRFDRKRGIVTLEYPNHVDEMYAMERIIIEFRSLGVELRIKSKI